MLTPTQVEIIGYLLNQESPQTIRGIARQLGKSYTLTYNNIEDLCKKEIIYKQKVPPAQIITLNRHAPANIFVEAENKKKETFLEKHPWIKVFLKDVFSQTEQVFFILLVFGSFTKGKQTSKSDLDILAIVPQKENIHATETAIRNAYTKVKKHLVVVDQKNFLEMIKKSNQLNVGTEAKNHHIILSGVEQYYQLLRKTE